MAKYDVSIIHADVKYMTIAQGQKERNRSIFL